jgi:hypothetical protein
MLPSLLSLALVCFLMLVEHDKRTTAQKTWKQFKVDFSTAYREYRLTNQMTQQSGFRSVNLMIENNQRELLQ